MKVIILLDHMAGHDLTLPTNAELKDRYGHQLWRLWRHVQAVVGPQLRADMDNSANDEIENLVFSHLDLFAKRSRYYNLDALTGVSSGDDPLKSWKRILDQTVALHLMPEKIKSNKQAKNLAKAMKPVVFHHAFGLDHQPLSLESALSVGPLYEKANGHIVRSLLNMIRLLQRALHDASGRAQAREQEIDNSLMRIPYMYEFMDWVPFDARELLKRKTF